MLDMYDWPSKEEVRKIVSQMTWTKQDKQKKDDLDDDGQGVFVESCYSPIQTWGATDYEDHRKDSLAVLRKLIKAKLLGENGKGQNVYGLSQRGHFYDSEGNPVRTIVVRGYYGGYTGRFVYPSGTTAFNRKANNPESQIKKGVA